MKIVILAMDDPLYTNKFIKDIINAREKDIIGFVHLTKGNRLTIGKKRSKLAYLTSLLLIMGPWYFFKNSLTTLVHIIKIKLSKLGLCNDPTVYNYAKNIGLNSVKIDNPNSQEFHNYIKDLKPDVIINQSQAFIKNELLEIPKIGVINRHNALLPKNRGRLTPFWTLYKEEEQTGVSIHFINEELDAGDIIVQKKFNITKSDSFNTIVDKNYKLAGEAILEALDLLESGNYNLIPNYDSKATYNTIPTLKEAWEYRKKRF